MLVLADAVASVLTILHIAEGEILTMLNLKSSRFQDWLNDLPDDSIRRLRAINMSTNSSKHVILALTYGIFDLNIRRINRMITYMLVARMKAERANKTIFVQRINQFMEYMHESIDAVTGFSRADRHSSSPCNRKLQAS